MGSFFSRLLAAVAKLDAAKIKQFMDAAGVLIAIFGGGTGASETGNLENLQLSDEDNSNVSTISQKLSAHGAPQAQFDIGKLIAFVKLMRSLFGAQ